MLISGVPVHCINQAAIQYNVPAVVIVAVLKTENGKNGEAKKNPNGTIDYGPMQVNSVWLKKLAYYGITAYDLQYNPCVNVSVGTWILAQQIVKEQAVWKGIGDYHSHTFGKNQKYQGKVSVTYDFIEQALAKGQ